MPTANEKRKRLRGKLDGGDFIVAPGVFDMISARIADSHDFDALYMTGYGISASYLGLPDAGFATLTDMAACARRIAEGTETPLIADADTGYGGPLNVHHTIRSYEAAGVAGIQLEDQEFPKKCGHTLGRKVIPLDDMVTKIKVAVEAREDPNLLIVARTDARTTLGLDEALRRAEAFEAAGADVLFVESPESEAEMERIGQSTDRPLLANIVEGGRTPALPAERLREIGYRIAIYPATGFLAVGAALESIYTTLEKTGSSGTVEVPLTDFEAFNRTVGFEKVWAFDKKWGSDD
jgi:2-methylisocitrate lyase-like PEP mutase family enzyme